MNGRRILQQIANIIAECCIDYDKNSESTKRLQAIVQNKCHYAITNQTTAKISYDSADKNQGVYRTNNLEERLD